MGLAVHQEAAAAVDAFAAVVLEAHRPFPGADQLFVELIEGLQQGEVGGDVLQLMILNGIYDGDIQRFERVSHEQTAAGA